MTSSAAQPALERPLPMFKVERAAIVAALKYTHGSIDGAAYFLEMGKSTLYRKIHDYEIRAGEYIGGIHDDHRG